MKTQIAKRLNKTCSICSRRIRVIIYPDRIYRGGHYFGKIPLHSKKELAKALKAGTHKIRIGAIEFEVLNRDPKPYNYAEYWECPKCYWKNN